MLKKFLGIFKRDKREFSDEELKWQIKMLNILFFIILAILGVLIKMTKHDIAIIIFLLSGLCVLVFLLIKLGRVIDQININTENSTKQAILEMIEDKYFNNLEILDEEFIQEIFQECLRLGVIEITTENEIIKITIKTSKKECLVKEEILEYINIKE